MDTRPASTRPSGHKVRIKPLYPTDPTNQRAVALCSCGWRMDMPTRRRMTRKVRTHQHQARRR